MPTRIDWITSLRRLRRKPLYTLTVALALGIGVAAATIVFSWFEAFFLNPLPGVRASHSLQVFELRRADYDTTAFSQPDYRDMAEGLKPAMDLAAFSMSRVTLNGTGKPEEHWVLFVSDNFFSVLELKSAAGRLIGPSDKTSAGAVLSYEWWQTRFKADPAVIGQTIYLNKQPVRIAGVAPPEFQGPYTGLSLGLYLPVSLNDSIEGGNPRAENRRANWLTLIARLKPGVSAGQASEAVAIDVRRLDQTYPKGNFQAAKVSLKPFWQCPVGAQAIMGPIMLALAGVVLMVLLIACSNATGMMLLENALRRRDMSIRLSLGAGGGGLIGNCLAEAFILSALAAGAGLLVTRLAADHLQALVPDINFPVKLNFPIDGPVLGFSILAAAATAIFCGLWSGLEARWQSISLTLRGEAASTSSSRERSRVRSAFIGAQITLSFVLLSSAAFIYRGIERAHAIDLGFNAQSVSIVRIDLAGNRYTPNDGTALFQRTLAALEQSPGVEKVSLAKSVPLGMGDQERVSIIPDGREPQDVWGNRVSPGYFATLDIPLLEGREFSALDTSTSGRVAIVNEALARRIWNSSAPVGASFFIGDKRYQVVGVAKNTKIWSLTADAQPFLYLPLWQSYAPNVAIHVKSKEPAAWVYRLVEREMEHQDSLLPIISRQTMRDQVEVALFPQRIALVMLAIFCLLGIYLTAIGLYGVIAHATRSRTKEIAIRMALGATAGEIRMLVSRQTARLVGGGLCAGALLAGLLSRLLQSIMTDAGGLDLNGIAGTAALIALVAVAATWIPIHRATRVETAAALRAD